jgi:predicted transcriptional regulator
MAAYDKYDLAEIHLKGFTRSAVRTKTLLCLNNHDMETYELEKELEVRATTILHSIKDMIEEGLVRKSNKGYSLTNVGKVDAMLIDQLVSTMSVLDEHRDFWLTHDISGIPTKLITRIGLLSQSDVVASDPIALLKAQEYFMEQVIESKEIHGVSPIVVPGYAEAIAAPVMKGAETDLILTDSLLKIVAREYHDAINELMNYENFRLYRIRDDIKVAFTVTDAHLYLGLFRLDGTYDIGQDLFCTGKGAVAWGFELFEYYRGISKPVKNINETL